MTAQGEFIDEAEQWAQKKVLKKILCLKRGHIEGKHEEDWRSELRAEKGESQEVESFKTM